MLTCEKVIWVTFQKEGIHAYPQAATDPNLKDVSFLAHPHRHMFHFKVYIEVFHDDRDIEFIQFKHWLISLFGADSILNISGQSCEMLAEKLIKHISHKYPHRDIAVEVSEDGENGCVISHICFPADQKFVERIKNIVS